jgi:hypothetical protein
MLIHDIYYYQTMYEKLMVVYMIDYCKMLVTLCHGYGFEFWQYYWYNLHFKSVA